MRINMHWDLMLLVLFFGFLPIGRFDGVEEKEFACKNGKVISAESFCDGINDCDDNEDESSKRKSKFQISCLVSGRRSSCSIHRDYICNKTVTCQGLTACDVGCPSYYKCQNSNTCVPRATLCDGDSCNGCPEDDEWVNGGGFFCWRNRKYCHLPQQLLWDEVNDCDNGADLCFPYNDSRGKTSLIDESRCWFCLDRSMIIPSANVCNGKIDCLDLSDECLCRDNRPSVCNHVYLRVWDHQLERIGKYSHMSPSNNPCKAGYVHCYPLQECISRYKVCDGVVDCVNGFDESFDFCLGTSPCNDTNNSFNTTCRCSRECFQNKHGESHLATFCDGNLECGSWEDECNEGCPSSFDCGNLTLREHDQQIQLNLTSCARNVDSAEDELAETISLNQICDGFPDCEDKSDEADCDKRFYCSVLNGHLISISNDQVCDGIINCDEIEDERDCFGDKRFYCKGGVPLFVTHDKVYDGIKDCEDWSDECTDFSHVSNSLSSRQSLIENKVLGGLVLLMALPALIGNMIVIYGESKVLRRLATKHDVCASLRANHMLVLNLAVADLLMGVYLVMLSAAENTYRGRFCLVKTSWLTSSTCATMGVLVVLSSETSVFTMLLLTACRLYSVFRPISSLRKPTFRLVLLLIFLTWFISFAVSLLPLTGFQQNSFYGSALLKRNAFFVDEVITFEEAKRYVIKLVTYAKEFEALPLETAQSVLKISKWSDLEKFLETFAPEFDEMKVDKLFGYYSSSSVCLPQIFEPRGFGAWKYSLSITIINCLVFVCVALMYVAVAIKIKRSQIKRSGTRTNGGEIQRKIIRLIITDFCCWIPLSIMVFVNFSGVKIDSVSYAVAGIVLLPINSALNPILYSNFVDKTTSKCFRNFKVGMKRFCRPGQERYEMNVETISTNITA